MAIKVYNSYRITHENGSVEDINATDLVQALENMEIAETESAVLQTFLVKKNIRTLVEDEPKEVIFTTVVAEDVGGSIATPATGKVHVGDMIQLKAIADKNYKFVSWSLNGEKISEESTVNVTIPTLETSVDTIVFTANFALADIEWTTAVEPEDATTAGCISFPVSGTSKANSTLELLAVAKDGFTFDHWEVNGESIGETELLKTVAEVLKDSETSRVYKAIFKAN